MARKAASATPLMVALDSASETTLFRQIYDSIRERILDGRLRPGTRVPSTRTLATELGVSRSTVVLAYQHLLAEGYLSSASGSGSFVSHQLPDAAPRRPATLVQPSAPRSPGPRRIARRAAYLQGLTPPMPHVKRAPVPFRSCEPALAEFPTRLWTQLYARRARKSPSFFLRYGDPAGYRPLREAIVTYLAAARGVRATVDQVMLVRGTQQAIDLATRILIDPGDAAWVEDPGYLAARNTFAAAGARVVGVPVDGEGLDVAAGERAAPHARLAYVAPSHQFPLGVTLSLRRRLALLDWASRAGAWVIEDDYDGEFRYAGHPLMALQGLDDEHRVLYVGTFSKTIFPALRLGYVILPPDLVEPFGIARRLADIMTPTLEQAVVADVLNDGHFARHVRRMRSIYRARQEALVEAVETELGGVVRAEPADTGLHLVGWLPPGTDDRALAHAAHAAGIEAPPLSLYGIEARVPPALLLGYASFDERTIRNAARALAGVLGASGVGVARRELPVAS